MIESSEGRIDCALPEIIRLINTAPSIEHVHVVLDFHCRDSGCVTSLGRLDWSLLDHLQSNSTGARPRIDLCITVDEGTVGSPEIFLDALAGSKVLMDLVKRGLVKRGLVILESERILALWEG